MKNLKLGTLFIFILFVFSSISAQDAERREQVREKMKAQRAAYITQKLELTEVEAQKFWPIFNQFDSERRAILEDRKIDISGKMTEKEAETAIDDYFTNKNKEMELQKKYVSKFKTVLPTSKVALLLTIQKEFSKEVMENMRDRRKLRPEGDGQNRPYKRNK